MDNDTYANVSKYKTFPYIKPKTTTDYILHAAYFFISLMALFILITLCCGGCLHLKEQLEERRRREERRQRLREESHRLSGDPPGEQEQQTDDRPSDDASDDGSSSQHVSGDEQTTSLSTSQNFIDPVPVQRNVQETIPDSDSESELVLESDIPQNEKHKKESRRTSSTVLNDFDDSSEDSSSPRHSPQHLKKSVKISKRDKIENIKRPIDFEKLKRCEKFGERKFKEERKQDRSFKSMNYPKASEHLFHSRKSACPGEGAAMRKFQEGVRLRDTKLISERKSLSGMNIACMNILLEDS